MSKATPTSAKSKRIAVIDADTIVYAAASVSERLLLGDSLGETWIDTQSLVEAYDQVVTSTEAIKQAVDAEQAFICLTHRENFRMDLLPSYKANRKEHREPAYRKPLLDLLQDRKPYPVLCIRGLEAGDACGISAGALARAGHTAIICSEDKDLKTVPGWLYQKGKLSLITRRAADYWHMWQTLCGDTTDHYAGCRNVGPAKADALLEAFMEPDAFDNGRVWERVLAEFTLRGHSPEYALTQARVARILRFEDWDPETRAPILWTPKAAKRA